jgi:tRNA dimethylallyltransferase
MCWTCWPKACVSVASNWKIVDQPLLPAMTTRPPAIFLMGPTASGKTGVAVELAQHLPIELISVDSALVFRDMDIGTAKPDAATLTRAPHHLIDIIDPTEVYSAAAFRKDALRLMADITARGKVPLLVGGTMLYYKALREGLSPLPQADATIRTQLDAEIAQHGIEALHAKLAEVDAETAARLHSTDTQRVQRAMEIYLASGKPMSELIKQQEQNPLPYDVLSIALIPSDRSVLHDRIASRFEKMLCDGLVDELRALRDRYPLHRDMTSMRCVGYRQAWEFLEGEIDEAVLMEKGIAATRQLAKRQLTWLRSMPENIEVDCLAPNLYEQVFSKLGEMRCFNLF